MKWFIRGASLIRLTFGVTGVVAPARLARVCGIADADLTEEAEYMLRMFASRDLLLAVDQLAASFGSDERAVQALRDAAITGLSDAAMAVLEYRRRGAVTGGLRTGVAFGITDGVGFTAAWLSARRRVTA